MVLLQQPEPQRLSELDADKPKILHHPVSRKSDLKTNLLSTFLENVLTTHILAARSKAVPRVEALANLGPIAVQS